MHQHHLRYALQREGLARSPQAARLAPFDKVINVPAPVVDAHRGTAAMHFLLVITPAGHCADTPATKAEVFLFYLLFLAGHGHHLIDQTQQAPKHNPVMKSRSNT